MDIPNRFKLGGQTIEVSFDPMLVTKEDNLGHACYRTNELVLQPHTEAVPRTTEQIDQVFFHEITHFILNKMGEDELAANEKFVDLFGTFLHQMIQTAEYD